jgi:arrestin-related trafficking adapter 3/6
VIERVEYHAHLDAITHTDPYNPVVLLSLKYPPPKGGEGHPILPLVTPFENSPLYSLLAPGEDPSQVAANYVGPGPWTFRHDLRIPASCTRLHFTNRNLASNITVTHHLKITLRVQKGDDQTVDSKAVKPKLFDIVVGKPVQILSVSASFYLCCDMCAQSDGLQCRCNWERTALPQYSQSFSGHPTSETCPCKSQQLTFQSVRADRSPVRAPGMPSRSQSESLYEQNSQFERLVSGQESEVGDAPPSYDSAIAAA